VSVIEAYVYEAIRTPRGKGKPSGALYGVRPISLITGLIDELRRRLPGLDGNRIDDLILGINSPMGDLGGVLSVPVLQLTDELSLNLPRSIRDEARAAAQAAGEKWIPHPAERVYDKMVEELGRTGRAGGAGFYDYEDGKRTQLWPGLAEAFGPPDADAVPFIDMVERLLFSEAVEALRCLEEGAIGSAAEANVGSLLGIGYPKWTGGVVQYINGYQGGAAGFFARARELAGCYGERFEPPPLLAAKVAAGEPIA
jgi:3-hydroxyacyl-CoA dehydrogenase / enoyl-CoA hydratase / 3-hydroxybutyryl-CoA epimerase